MPERTPDFSPMDPSTNSVGAAPARGRRQRTEGRGRFVIVDYFNLPDVRRRVFSIGDHQAAWTRTRRFAAFWVQRSELQLYGNFLSGSP